MMSFFFLLLLLFLFEKKEMEEGGAGTGSVDHRPLRWPPCRRLPSTM
jgi:hypothetical protein